MFGTARQVIEVGREAFFQKHDPDLPLGRSAELQIDDLAPQFGFVGSEYAALRILLLGINPGNGRSNKCRTEEDERMMPAILEFAEAPTAANFEKATAACMSECQRWHIWNRHCSEIMSAGKLSLVQIAYSNCLPWRTHSGSDFSGYVDQKTAKLYVAPLIEELKPRLIVVVGKRKPPAILKMTGLSLPEIIVWNCSWAPTETALRERATAAEKIRRFFSAE